MLATCFSTTFGEMKSSPRDRGVGPALGEQREHFPLTRGEFREGVAASPGVQQVGDDLGVEHGAAIGDPGDRVDEVADVRNPVL